ncbi:MAG TPA: prepilin-type N-terminal cleavage/methylation domain-containing protein [Tepidisphaeraceae bacterium]|jgi:prepilin-type N-terminal cleavage/methylation domain-containing protein
MRRGFTLMEAAIVTVIIGVGVVALMQLITAGTMATAASKELTTAVQLGNNINEMMQGASFSTLKSTYDEVTYNPPKDALGNNLTQFSGWTQQIDVSYVDHNYVALVVPDTQTTEPMCRVTVIVTHNSKPIYTQKWLVAAP